MTGAAGPHAPLAERIRRIAYVATPWFPPSDCAALREAAAVLERVEPQPQENQHRADLRTRLREESEAKWSARKRAQEAEGRAVEYEAALRDAEAQLTQGSGSPECHYALGIIRAALAAQPPVPLQQENQHRADLRQARATASGAPDGEANP